MLNLIAFLFVIGICVISHEGGHYLAAKWRNVLVHEFSFGMGPAIYQKQKGETLWSFRAFPIGGYVKLEGEDASLSEDINNKIYGPSRSLSNKKPWERLVIILSGATVNLLLAWILTVIYLSGHGVYVFETPIIGKVIPDNPAYIAGLKEGDIIKSINGTEIREWADIKKNLQVEVKDDNFLFTINRNDEDRKITINIPQTTGQSERLLGIQPPLVKLPVYQATLTAWDHSWKLATEIIRSLVKIVFRKSHSDVVGPVGVAVIAGNAIKQGFWAFIVFLGVINLNLGLLNLFPFPALDGGRAVFILFEMITKKKVPEKYEAWIHYAGFFVLIALIIMITVKDIFVIFKR